MGQLKWWETTDIMQREADTTRQRMAQGLSWLEEQQRARRQDAERRAAEDKKARAEAIMNHQRTMSRMKAREEIIQANEKLTQMGQRPIPLTCSSYDAQWHSGFTMAQAQVLEAERGIALQQYEAEQQLYEDTRAQLIKEGLLTPETDPGEAELRVHMGAARKRAEESLKRGDYESARYWNDIAQGIHEGRVAVDYQLGDFGLQEPLYRGYRPDVGIATPGIGIPDVPREPRLPEEPVDAPAGHFPFRDEQGQDVVMPLYTWDFGLETPTQSHTVTHYDLTEEEVLRYQEQTRRDLEDRGLHVVEQMHEHDPERAAWTATTHWLKGEREDKQLAEVGFSVDPESGDIFVVSDGEVVGSVDPETGDLELERAFERAIRGDYLREYADLGVDVWGAGARIEVQNRLQEFMYTRKVVGDRIIPAPAEVLATVGLGVMFYKLGEAAVKGLYGLLAQPLGKLFRHVPAYKVPAQAPKPPTHVKGKTPAVVRNPIEGTTRYVYEISKVDTVPRKVRPGDVLAYQRFLKSDAGKGIIDELVKAGKDPRSPRYKQMIYDLFEAHRTYEEAQKVPQKIAEMQTRLAMLQRQKPTKANLEEIRLIQAWLKQSDSLQANLEADAKHQINIVRTMLDSRLRREHPDTAMPRIAGLLTSGQPAAPGTTAPPTMEVPKAPPPAPPPTEPRPVSPPVTPRTPAPPITPTPVTTAPVATGVAPRLGEYITRAVQEDPRRLVHDARHDFFVLDGRAVPRREISGPEIARADEAVSVHSHLPSNWEEALAEGRITMPQDTFSGGDIDNLRKALKGGYPHTLAVITSPTTADTIAVSPDATPDQLDAFKRMGPETIRKALGYDKPTTTEEMRQALRDFSSRYGLSYHENVLIPDIRTGIPLAPGVTPAEMPITQLETRRAEILEMLKKPATELSAGVRKIALREELRAIDAQLAPEERKLRQSIMATVKSRALPLYQYKQIFREKGGSSELHRITYSDLKRVLASVRQARPKKIGTRNVITQSTERKLGNLKTTLIGEGKLTEAAFDDMVKKLRLPATGYESPRKFITEKQGKELIRMMNDEAEVGLIARQVKVSEALGKNPAVKAKVDEWGKRIAKAGEPYLEGKAPDVRWRVEVLKDMRFLTEDLQIRTGRPFYDVYFHLNRQHLANDAYLADAEARLIASTSEYTKLIHDKASMTRIRDWIAAKQAWAKVESPEDITPEEIKLAKAYEKELFDLQPDFRYRRFMEMYHQHEGDASKIQEHIPDAPREELRRAIDIYEGQGATELRKYLDERTWGVMGSGYEPHYVVSTRLAMRKLRAVFPTRRFEPRTGVEFYPEDITIDRAVKRYIGQLRSYSLRPYVRRMEQLYAESIPQLEHPGRVRQMLTGMANEMLGYVDRTFLGELAMKVASQAFIVIFGTSIDLPFRNIFQNLAFSTHKTTIIDPRNRKLTDYESKWYAVNTAQMKAIKKHHLLSEEAGLPPFPPVNRVALRLNLYGLADDKVNRKPCFWGYLNKAERALQQYRKDGDIDRFIAASGMSEMTLMQQQKQVLENLVLDTVNYDVVGPTTGQHAATLEIGNEVTNNIHLVYDRAQRAPIEHGEGGRLIGSLSVFARGVGQRVAIQLSLLDPRSYAPPPKKKGAMKVLLSMLFGSLAANYLFQRMTGKPRAPYDPLNLLQWSPGGLALGAIQQMGEVSGLLLMAMAGSDWAKGQLPTALTRAGDTFVPWYKSSIRLLEVALERKYIDRQAWRELRHLIEKAMYEMGFMDKVGDVYTPNRSYYEAERSWEWKIKHALFGTEKPELTPEERALRAQRDLLAQYAYGCDWNQLTSEERKNMKERYPELKD